jgi:hypothetical protein
MSKQSRKKWCCLNCSQRSARHWNLKVHIKRRHTGIGVPIDEEQFNEIKDKMSNHFFYHNYPYSANYLSGESQKGKEKERDIIDETYQMVIERREKLRKIKEIKSFFNELSSLSSSLQQPVTITSLIQTPIIQPIIPPITTTAPLQPTSPPQPAQTSQEQEQKKMIIINPETDLITNLFITSTFMAEDLQRIARGVGKGGEDAIIIPQEPSLLPYMMTTTNEKNNNSKKRGVEPNPITENMKEEQELEEDSHDIEEYHIEEHPSSKSDLLIDNEDDDYVINNNINYDDESSNIDNNYYYSSDVSLVTKRDDHGDIYE